jgi:MoaA/NifB/PqqE/SkfB family radical SAM enzyme
MLQNIQIKYPSNFPDNFTNDVHGWAFSQETILANRGKLLTMDIDFGSKCSLSCPHCFKKGFRESDVNIGLNIEQLENIILEAKSLGLKSIKIVGKGEPFETPEILNFIEFLSKNQITPLIFTKGHILGSEDKVRKIYSDFNINSSSELISRIYESGASILLGYNSKFSETQDQMVGQVSGFSNIRNRALELLVSAGFNEGNPTRLGLIMAPLTNENYEEAYNFYVWARRRNLYPVITPTMISGHLKDGDKWQEITPSNNRLIDLYLKIYNFNISNNIQTLSQIIEEGISAYIGAHPCNQVSTGMYVTSEGTVLHCPGNDDNPIGNVIAESLTEIWQKQRIKNKNLFNNGCPAKLGKSIPSDLFEKVISKLTNK